MEIMSVHSHLRSFVDIPEELFDRKEKECWKILESSVTKHNGAYSLTI